MASVLHSSLWQQLQAHYEQQRTTHMRELFAHDSKRFERFSVRACGLLLDYSKNRITPDILNTLLQLAEASNLRHHIKAMFQGEYINTTEQRQAHHIALRAAPDSSLDPMRQQEIEATRQKMHQWVEQLHQGQWRGATGQPITDFVSIGIGGSFLGPKIVSEALKPYWQQAIRGHFVANIDGMALQTKLAQLNPETTLFIVASKSFTTQETLNNAISARNWLAQHGIEADQLSQHFIAISANIDKATEFGIDPTHILPMWDWVGGRYSLWSAIGLPIALLIGNTHFSDLLAGAAEMDNHFYETSWDGNLPVILAMLGIWYINFFKTQTHALLCYDHLLRGLPAYIQQLDMESNGKAVNHDGEPIDVATAPITWGGEGTNGQHAFHQLLHQSRLIVPVDFILPLTSHTSIGDHHKILAANCFGQSQALMQGCTYAEAYNTTAVTDAARLAPHKMMPGNKPSNTILVHKMTPKTLGSLIAMYEHKTFVQGHIWGINSFDQWGVELGKSLGNEILKQWSENAMMAEQDNSTHNLMKHFQQQSLS